MKIGVDARPLCNPLTGIGRYTVEMLKRLSDSEHTFYFYSDKSYDKTEFDGENIIHRKGRIRYGMLSSIFAQFFFPLWAKRDGLDIFWSPRHHLPLLLSKKIIPVVTIHDLVWMYSGKTMHPLGYWLERFLMPRSIAMAKSIAAVSRLTQRDIIREFKLSEKKVVYIPNASTMTKPEGPENEINTCAEDFFLFVGTLEPRKNLERLLIAYRAYLHQSEKKIPLKIAGGQGWGNISIDSLICRLGLQDSVTLLGKVSDKKLMALYEAAYALLMPSLYEGFGMPVLEAMSYGVPVIISQKSSMEEVAENAALLIDPLDTDSMATAMYRLETDNVLHKSLSAAAKKRATLYSWDESSNQLLSLLEDVFQNYGKINP